MKVPSINFRLALAALVILLFSVSAVWAGKNFQPYETPAAVSATTTSSATTFTLPAAIAAPDVKVCNSGSVTAYWVCGNTSVVATVPGAGSTSTSMEANLCGVYTKGSGSTTCAAITASGSTAVTFTAGQGN